MSNSSGSVEWNAITRCSFHIVMALPLFKGFFFSAVALLEFFEVFVSLTLTPQEPGVTGGHQKGDDDGEGGGGGFLCLFDAMFFVGVASLALTTSLHALIGLAYVLPLLLSVWSPYTVACLVVPLLVYCIILSSQPVAELCSGDTSNRTASLARTILVALPQLASLLVTVAVLHLSRIYYLDDVGRFGETWERLAEETVGHFFPVVDNLKVSWEWPSGLQVFPPQVCLGITVSLLGIYKTRQAGTLLLSALKLTECCLLTKDATKAIEMASSADEEQQSKGGGAGKAVSVAEVETSVGVVQPPPPINVTPTCT